MTIPHRSAGLLCELHAHTTWSDGAIDLDAVVDGYGQAGFDVLCLTDHVVRDGGMVGEHVAPRYFAAVAAAGRRARDRYGMLVIPGLELTWDDPDDAAAAHAVVLGVASRTASRTPSSTPATSARRSSPRIPMHSARTTSPAGRPAAGGSMPACAASPIGSS
jgi:hypothetical protein